MKFTHVFKIAAVSIFALTTAAHAAPDGRESVARGKVSYTSFSNNSAWLLLSGDTAEALFNDMTEAKFRPGAPDLETRPLDQISTKDVPIKTGVGIECMKKPKDIDGKRTFVAECLIQVENYKTGKILQ